ncbi:MAG: ABC transporter permease [Bdellovibrionales bacterium]|nr:ABC transporter permease [Bdellovibrionales bacterium]
MRYKRSILGFGWSLMGPLLNYAVVGFVFSVVARYSIPNYFLYLLSGAAIFNLVSASFTQSTVAMISNEHYIKKIYLPKSVFPITSVGMEAINFVFSICALAVIAVVVGVFPLSWSLLFLPIAMALAVCFCVGVGLVLSIAAVFFRDLIHILPILMQAVFFLSPVIYPEEAVPERYRYIMELNPFYHFVVLFRNPLYKGIMPTGLSIAVCVGCAVFAFVIGFTVLKRLENRIIFKL